MKYRQSGIFRKSILELRNTLSYTFDEKKVTRAVVEFCHFVIHDVVQ
jgi:hypothetical protein